MKKKLCISIVSIIVILSIVFIVVKILNSKRDRSSFNNEDTFFDVLDSKEYLKNMTTYKNKSKEYGFDIISSDKAVKSQAGGTSIILSPIGLMIDGQKRPHEVCINYKDGSKLNLVKNGELNDFLLDGVGSNNYSSEYRFKKCISIEGVESITVVNYDYEI